MKQAIVVLGMHRSGTSAVAGCLSSLGATPPRTEIGPSPCNPKGHFESMAIALFNDRLLEHLDSLWYDWRRLDTSSLSTKVFARLCDEAVRMIADEFGNANLIVVKDPRICRLVPLWRAFLEAAGYTPKFLLPVRRSLGTARSLQVRSQLSLETGRLLWLRHVLSAERQTRGRLRHILLADDFMRDWKSALGPALAVLGLRTLADELATAPDGFVEPDLFHLPDAQPSEGEHPAIADLAERVYARLACSDRDDFSAAMDQLSDEFERLIDLFQAPVGDLIAAIHRGGTVRQGLPVA